MNFQELRADLVHGVMSNVGLRRVTAGPGCHGDDTATTPVLHQIASLLNGKGERDIHRGTDYYSIKP